MILHVLKLFNFFSLFLSVVQIGRNNFKFIDSFFVLPVLLLSASIVFYICSCNFFSKFSIQLFLTSVSLPRLPTSLLRLLIFQAFLKTVFSEQFQVHKKIEGKIQTSHTTPCHRIFITTPVINITPQSNKCVTNNEPTLTSQFTQS